MKSIFTIIKKSFSSNNIHYFNNLNFRQLALIFHYYYFYECIQSGFAQDAQKNELSTIAPIFHSCVYQALIISFRVYTLVLKVLNPIIIQLIDLNILIIQLTEFFDDS